ncbi:MAG: GtrA family protein [Clostridiales bacterium]|nr:GtrA family protein [Clostridiales bacterium]
MQETQKKINKEWFIDVFKRIWHIKEWKSLYTENRQVANYIIFGVVTTVVSFISYWLARKFMFIREGGSGGEIDIALSTTFSWITSVTTAFITNRLWVFDGKVKGAKNLLIQTFNFYSSRFLTYIFEVGFMWVITSFLFPDNKTLELVAKIIANFFVLILNFILSKLFVFKKKK